MMDKEPSPACSLILVFDMFLLQSTAFTKCELALYQCEDDGRL
jgi:hypothetical protein